METFQLYYSMKAEFSAFLFYLVNSPPMMIDMMQMYEYKLRPFQVDIVINLFSLPI